MRRRAARLMVAAFAIAALGVPAGPAAACSCAPIDPVAGLDEYPAAFAGTFVSKTDVGDSSAMYTFTVERWVKGGLGDTIEVRAPRDGGGCGYEFQSGQRMASFLRIESGVPTGGLCYTVDPDVLLRAAEPLEFDGTGPPHLLVVGPFTEGTHAVVDAAGGLLTAFGDRSTGEAFGFRDAPRSFHPCPGGRFIVEQWSWRLIVRDLATLEATTTIDLEGFADHIGVGDVDCRDQRASSISMIGDEWIGDRSVVRVYEAVPEPVP